MKILYMKNVGAAAKAGAQIFDKIAGRSRIIIVRLCNNARTR
jgi:hypothetical protein